MAREEWRVAGVPGIGEVTRAVVGRQAQKTNAEDAKDAEVLK
jgi:hypothetical protein